MEQISALSVTYFNLNGNMSTSRFIADFLLRSPKYGILIRKQKHMAFAPKTTCRLLLALGVTLLVMTHGTLLAFANDALVIRPMTSLRVEADERVKIQAVVDTTSPHPLAFVWEQKYGDHLSLRNDMSDTVYFVAPKVTTQTDYQLMVLVSDGVTQAHSDVTITVLPYQAKLPLANAGIDQNVHSGDHVALNASASADDDSLALTYLWQQKTGPSVVFAPTVMETSFIAPVVKEPTALEFLLQVRDEINTSEDMVKVVVSPASPTTTQPLPQPEAFSSTPVPSTQSEVIVEPYSDLNRVTLVQDSYRACFPDNVLDKSTKNALIQKILTTGSPTASDTGITKIEMLRDVISICDLEALLPASSSGELHYPDITNDSPALWKREAQFAYEHNLFEDQPLFLPYKTMQKSDLNALLLKIKSVKSPPPATLSTPEVQPSLLSKPSLPPVVSETTVDKSASASVLNQVLAPKFAVFAILFLVGVFCIAYSLLYSRKPMRAKNTYISLPNVPPHDRR